MKFNTGTPAFTIPLILIGYTSFRVWPGGGREGLGLQQCLMVMVITVRHVDEMVLTEGNSDNYDDI